MTTVSLEGLQSGISGEDRAIALLKVVHKGVTYDWQIFVPDGVNLPEFVANSAARVGAEIDVKEAAWAALAPKTRPVQDPMTGETRVEDIPKSEIVCPEIPDYFAKRREEYPSLGEQLDALWKGDKAAAALQARIQAVKKKYPKPSWLT